MNKFMLYVLTILISIIAGYQIGYVQGHFTVATECERLGKFFVGKKVYHCVKIEEVKE